jgi:hypothetical protein
MTGGRDRKALIAAYKERKTAAGIYAVRCVASGRVWVGRAPNLDTVENRLRFSLRTGNHPNRTLQAAWSARGGDGFSIEPLERLEDDAPAYARDRRLKDRLAHWRCRLDAPAV